MSLKDLSRKKIIAKCGHETLTKGCIHGKIESRSISLNKNGQPKYCLQCLEKMIRKCSKCGADIFPNEKHNH